MKWRNSLVHHSLDAIASLAENIHARAVREAHKVVARAVKEVAAARGVEVKEDARDDNDLFLETGLEEVEAIRDGVRETLEVQPASTISLCFTVLAPQDPAALTGKRSSRARI